MKQLSFLGIFLLLVCLSDAQTGPSVLKDKGLPIPSNNGPDEKPTYIPLLQEDFPYGEYDVGEEDYNDEYKEFEKQYGMVTDYDESFWPFVEFANNEEFTPSKNTNMEMDNDSDELENDSASKLRFFDYGLIQGMRYPQYDFVNNEEFIPSENAEIEMESSEENDSDELNNDTPLKLRSYDYVLPQGMSYPQYDTILEISGQEEREQMLNEPTYDFGNPIPSSSQDDSDQWPFLNIVEPQNKYVKIFLQNKIPKPEQQLMDTVYSKGSNQQILTIVKESVIFLPAEFNENRDRPILPISRETFDTEEGKRVGYKRFVLLMGPVLMGFGLLFFCLACITKRKEKCRRKTLKKSEIPYKPVVEEV